MYLNYFTSIQQILSGLVVSVVQYTGPFGSGSNPTIFHINFFFFQIKETCTFMNISSLKHHLRWSSKCDIKAENSSTLCKFHEGRKGLRPMGSNADQWMKYLYAHPPQIDPAPKWRYTKSYQSTFRFHHCNDEIIFVIDSIRAKMPQKP